MNRRLRWAQGLLLAGAFVGVLTGAMLAPLAGAAVAVVFMIPALYLARQHEKSTQARAPVQPDVEGQPLQLPAWQLDGALAFVIAVVLFLLCIGITISGKSAPVVAWVLSVLVLAASIRIQLRDRRAEKANPEKWKQIDHERNRRALRALGWFLGGLAVLIAGSALVTSLH